MLEVGMDVLMPGMKLARPVYNQDGLMLLRDGERLEPSMIRKVRTQKIQRIYIHWPDSESPEAVSVIKEDTRKKAIQCVMESMGHTYQTQFIAIERIQDQVEEILNEILTIDDVLVNLTHMRTLDDYTFGHSVNVCVLALVMGTILEMDEESLRELGTGAMVHDVGKMFIDPKILTKPHHLDPEEYELVKKHTELGMKLIQNINQLPVNVIHIIQYHHEWYNGAGYPEKLAKEEIPFMARIVAICDVYDALTSDRVYKEKVSPQQALEYLICMGNRQFDFQLLKQFVQHICVYRPGTDVRLSTGEKARVLANNPHWPTRPVVRVIHDEKETTLHPFKVIDLSRKYGIEIIE